MRESTIIGTILILGMIGLILGGLKGCQHEHELNMKSLEIWLPRRKH